MDHRNEIEEKNNFIIETQGHTWLRKEDRLAWETEVDGDVCVSMYDAKIVMWLVDTYLPEHIKEYYDE